MASAASSPGSSAAIGSSFSYTESLHGVGAQGRLPSKGPTIASLVTELGARHGPGTIGAMLTLLQREGDTRKRLSIYQWGSGRRMFEEALSPSSFASPARGSSRSASASTPAWVEHYSALLTESLKDVVNMGMRSEERRLQLIAFVWLQRIIAGEHPCALDAQTEQPKVEMAVFMLLGGSRDHLLDQRRLLWWYLHTRLCLPAPSAGHELNPPAQLAAVLALRTAAGALDRATFFVREERLSLLVQRAVRAGLRLSEPTGEELTPTGTFPLRCAVRSVVRWLAANHPSLLLVGAEAFLNSLHPEVEDRSGQDDFVDDKAGLLAAARLESEADMWCAVTLVTIGLVRMKAEPCLHDAEAAEEPPPDCITCRQCEHSWRGLARLIDSQTLSSNSIVDTVTSYALQRGARADAAGHCSSADGDNADAVIAALDRLCASISGTLEIFLPAPQEASSSSERTDYDAHAAGAEQVVKRKFLGSFFLSPSLGTIRLLLRAAALKSAFFDSGSRGFWASRFSTDRSLMSNGGGSFCGAYEDALLHARAAFGAWAHLLAVLRGNCVPQPVAAAETVQLLSSLVHFSLFGAVSTSDVPFHAWPAALRRGLVVPLVAALSSPTKALFAAFGVPQPSLLTHLVVPWPCALAAIPSAAMAVAVQAASVVVVGSSARGTAPKSSPLPVAIFLALGCLENVTTGTTESRTSVSGGKIGDQPDADADQVVGIFDPSVVAENAKRKLGGGSVDLAKALALIAPKDKRSGKRRRASALECHGKTNITAPAVEHQLILANSIADGTLSRAGGESALPSSPIPALLGPAAERLESNDAPAAVAASAAGATAPAASDKIIHTVRSGDTAADLRRMLNDRTDALRRAETNAASARIELAAFIASWDRRLDELSGEIASARAGLADVESRVLAVEGASAGHHRA